MTATWTTPRTWVTDEVVTAAQMNQHVRDNMDYIDSILDKYKAAEVYIPCSAWSPTSSSGADSAQSIQIGTYKPTVRVMDFDANQEQFADITLKMPSDWDAGSMGFQPVWAACSASTASVVWLMKATAGSAGVSMDTAWGATASTQFGNTGSDLWNISPSVGGLIAAGCPAAGQAVHIRFGRSASNASDTYAADARWIGATLFYTRGA